MKHDYIENMRKRYRDRIVHLQKKDIFNPLKLCKKKHRIVANKHINSVFPLPSFLTDEKKKEMKN